MTLTGAGPGPFRAIEDATAAELLAWRAALTVSPGFTLRPGLCGVARSIARMRGPGGRRRMVDSVVAERRLRPPVHPPPGPPRFSLGVAFPPPPPAPRAPGMPPPAVPPPFPPPGR